MCEKLVKKLLHSSLDFVIWVNLVPNVLHLDVTKGKELAVSQTILEVRVKGVQMKKQLANERFHEPFLGRWMQYLDGFIQD